MATDFPNNPTDGVTTHTIGGIVFIYSGGAWRGYAASIGSSGYSGYSATNISGFSGYSGANGISGFSGYSGISGFSGYSGFSRSGFSGYSGLSGFSGFPSPGGITGTGTVDRIVKFTSSNTVGNSTIYNDPGGPAKTVFLDGIVEIKDLNDPNNYARFSKDVNNPSSGFVYTGSDGYLRLKPYTYTWMNCGFALNRSTKSSPKSSS